MKRCRLIRLEQLREQQEVAEAAGISSSTLSQIENGHSRGQDLPLAKLAKALGVPVSEARSLTDDIDLSSLTG